jgi:hypothetical protein
MTPKGSLAYIAGLLVLFGGLGLLGLVGLYALAVGPQFGHVAPILLVLCFLLVFAALYLLAAGLYRMLCHLYRSISRTDPVGDRPLRGTRIFLLGQLASAMAVPTAAVFLIVPDVHPRPGDRDALLLLAGLPGAGILILAVLTFFAGLGLMVRDTFLRQRDIIDKRDADRRRRLEESDEADEPQTEVIPTVLPAELRAHIKEDR